MLQEIKIKNFKSFRDEVELSFESSADDRYSSTVTMPDGVKLILCVKNSGCIWC